MFTLRTFTAPLCVHLQRIARAKKQVVILKVRFEIIEIVAIFQHQASGQTPRQCPFSRVVTAFLRLQHAFRQLKPPCAILTVIVLVEFAHVCDKLVVGDFIDDDSVHRPVLQHEEQLVDASNGVAFRCLCDDATVLCHARNVMDAVLDKIRER